MSRKGQSIETESGFVVAWGWGWEWVTVNGHKGSHWVMTILQLDYAGAQHSKFTKKKINEFYT